MRKRDYSDESSWLNASFKYVEDLSTMLPVAWSGLDNNNGFGN